MNGNFFIELIIAGLKKFAVEIICALMLTVFLWAFPVFRSLFSYKDKHTDDKTKYNDSESHENIQKELDILHDEEQQLIHLREELKRKESELSLIKNKTVQDIQERAEIQRQLEIQRKEEERIKEKIQRQQELLRQAEERKAQEARQKADIERKREEQCREHERLKAELQRKQEELRQAELKKAQEEKRKEEVQRQLEAQRRKKLQAKKIKFPFSPAALCIVSAVALLLFAGYMINEHHKKVIADRLAEEARQERETAMLLFFNGFYNEAQARFNELSSSDVNPVFIEMSKLIEYEKTSPDYSRIAELDKKIQRIPEYFSEGITLAGKNQEKQNAKIFLGDLYFNGLGVVKDMNRALIYRNEP